VRSAYYRPGYGNNSISRRNSAGESGQHRGSHT